MKSVNLVALAGLGLMALGVAPALAQPYGGYVIADVNERAGPSTVYPPVIVIPAGAPILIYGCLEDYTWCDISWGANRGWMAAAYLQVDYDDRPVPLADYIVPLGIPLIAFDLDSYWGDYYYGRPFFAEEYRWRGYWREHYPPPRNFQPLPRDWRDQPNREPWQHLPPPGDHYPHYPDNNSPGDHYPPPGETYPRRLPEVHRPFFGGGQPDGQFYGTPQREDRNGHLKPGCFLKDGQVICPHQ